MNKKAILLLPLFLLRFAAGAQSIEEQKESSWYNSPIIWIILSAIALLALVVTTQSRKNNSRNKQDDLTPVANTAPEPALHLTQAVAADHRKIIFRWTGEIQQVTNYPNQYQEEPHGKHNLFFRYKSKHWAKLNNWDKIPAVFRDSSFGLGIKNGLQIWKAKQVEG